MDDRIEHATVLYERAVFGGDPGAPSVAEAALDGVEADLALARGRILHARFLQDRIEDPRELALFERAAQLHHAGGEPRGEAEALFWVGCYHQVVRGDTAASLPHLERSAGLARQEGDALTLSYALRHLAMAERGSVAAGTARALLEESTRLRRDLGFHAGVAANLIALAHLAAGDGRQDEIRVLLDEARALAESSAAHGVLRWVDRARAELEPGRPGEPGLPDEPGHPGTWL